MSVRDPDWIAGLSQLFSATVNQQTLEEAAELMVSVSVQDRCYHEECRRVFDSALCATEADDVALISAINGSGYRVSDRREALDLVRELQHIYLHKFHRAKAGKLPSE
jgi:hypothetical protein